jgi:hypothetical protein
MSDDLRDYGFTQHVARVMFAVGATALVAAGSYFGIRVVFGIGYGLSSKPPRGELVVPADA